MTKNIKIITHTAHKTIIRLEEAKKALSPNEFTELNNIIKKLAEYDAKS